MRKFLIGSIVAGVLGVSVFLGAQPDNEVLKVRLRLLEGNKSVAGIVRVYAGGKEVALPGLYDRMKGLTKDNPGVHWYIVPAGGVDVMLPRGAVEIEALSGLETARVRTKVEFPNKQANNVDIALASVFRPEDLNLIAGNTHLHLRDFTLAESDEYLRKIPAADRLRVMFVSYLERNKDDLTYITNKYPIGAMPKFDGTGVVFNNGEEHRHNFQAYGEGYGHVMFLNIKELVKPVSIGPGITGAGVDDLALRPGIDNAKKQGGTVIWCHNTSGFEDIPSAITGRLDAMNVYDGSRTGKFEDNYYRYLNIGLKVPISTGTDWFMYDWSRVYAKVKGELTIESWLNAVKAGRCQATNGPLLSLTVDGKTIGDVIDLKDSKSVKITASAVGRHPPQKLQLVRNGVVIKTQASAKDATRVELTHEVRVDEPAWFAVRIDSDAKNEFDRTLYAHTSPIYVTFQGKSVFHVESAVALLKQVEEGQGTIKARGNFSTPDAAKKMLALYDEAAKNLRDRIEARK